MRLDKYLAHNGFGTRKEVKELIKGSHVTVNASCVKDHGYIVKLDVDDVRVDGIAIRYEQDVYYMMNKPAGYICSHDAVQYPSVLELVFEQRPDLFFVGRLDADTEGLLVITNDGKFSHRVAHGKKDVQKQYHVRLKDPLEHQYIEVLLQGIPMDGTILKPALVEVIDDTTILLSISEGKYHQVKRMMHYCNNEVVGLKRLRIGALTLDSTLEPGEYRKLTAEEIAYFD